MRNKYFIFPVLLVLSCSTNTFSQTQPVPPTYPKVVGYLSFILPMVTVNKSTTTNDFSGGWSAFAIGFPIGVNVLYS